MSITIKTGATADSVALQALNNVAPQSYEEFVKQQHEDACEQMRNLSQHNPTQWDNCVTAVKKLAARKNLSKELKEFFEKIALNIDENTDEGNEWLPIIFSGQFAVYMMPNNNGHQRYIENSAYVFRVWDAYGVGGELDVIELSEFLSEKANPSTIEGITYGIAHNACDSELSEEGFKTSQIESDLISYAQLALASQIIEKSIGNGGNMAAVHGAKR